MRSCRVASLAALPLLAACSWWSSAPGPSTAPPERLQCEHKPDYGCFVFVPGATFLMGAQASDPAAPNHDADAAPDESPVHEVTLSSFWMQRDEFHISAYSRCLGESGCAEDDAARGGFSNLGDNGRFGHPVNSITWGGAARACAWYGGRLPTEAEWEYAARGKDARRFPWGDKPGCGIVPTNTTGRQGDLALGNDLLMREPPCLPDGTVDANGTRGTSPLGVKGMAGNVWEWVADSYGPYPSAAVTDPTGPATGERRVQRGGGWTSEEAVELRSASRMSLEPDERVSDVGFRCVWGTR